PSREACRADLSSSRSSLVKDEHPRLASPSDFAAGESLRSRRDSRFGALFLVLAGYSPVEPFRRAAPLISRRSSSTDFSHRRSRTEPASIEPPVTVRLDFHDPGSLSSRSHDGLRLVVTRALGRELSLEHSPGILPFGSGQDPRP